MEDLPVMEIVLGLVAVALPVAFVWLRKFVASSETKVDDKILEAVEKAFQDSKNKPE
jgi:hypothetical protein